MNFYRVSAIIPTSSIGESVSMHWLTSLNGADKFYLQYSSDPFLHHSLLALRFETRGEHFFTRRGPIGWEWLTLRELLIRQKGQFY